MGIMPRGRGYLDSISRPPPNDGIFAQRDAEGEQSDLRGAWPGALQVNQRRYRHRVATGHGGCNQAIQVKNPGASGGAFWKFS